ncbi:MAG: hypothetical protein J5610_03910 [Prevotella sp.]|nr:hypothetical protein [Prevotella sp.]
MNQDNKHRRSNQHDANIMLRQWLNIIFMIGAIIGVVIYLFGSQSTGIYVILGAMVFKIIECALRMFR